METLLDVVGVGLIIWGAAVVLISLGQGVLAGFIGREAGVGRVNSTGLAIAFSLVGLIFGGFLLWAGFTVVDIQNV